MSRLNRGLRIPFLNPYGTTVLVRILLIVYLGFYARNEYWLPDFPHDLFAGALCMILTFTLPVYGMIAAWRMNATPLAWFYVLVIEALMYYTFFIAILPAIS